MSRTRLDKYLAEHGLAPSREAARELIESGSVLVKGIVRTKPATMVGPDDGVSLAASSPRGSWVGRGALKLLKALDHFGIDPSGMSCADIGASTGGFTQVLLERGAARVAAVDVGYGQLAWSLRSDPRVVVLERTNARYVTAQEIGFTPEAVVADASFISLRLLLPNIARLTADGGTIVTLVKPQFEVGRGRTSKGVVRDASLHEEVLASVAELAMREDLVLHGATHSPIKGPEGNVEFLFYMIKGSGERAEIDLARVVADAHEELGG